MEHLKIEYFGKQEIISLRDEIQEALNKIKLKYGLTELNLHTINFNSFEFTSKISGKANNSEAINFKQQEIKFFALKNGLPTDFIGSSFILDGSIYKITKLITSRPKYPITAYSEETGKSFKFTAQRIKELLDKYSVIDISYQDVDSNILPE
ncbi:MAG: hypothetical protein A2275_02745 [Bacteroidetes bacterium RIFOXYA12_FULL_35_11]|nr:MAG: hypothetical protein A2X01_21215 [Bacteroidetes bacterium GWF2_35_48]OFY80924.1 MAG: hypothetical protein A2275_02745 [Bacteroidetes bacterium RIFOXYA12_FULL_35_11]HBX50468.1 hypothetical protein [Bacteroidales bacterium]